jgi:hypothetical protein
MKRDIFLLIAVVSFINAQAQATIKSDTANKEPGEIRTLFNNSGPVGWWVSPDFAWTFAVYTGVAQIIWINIQTLILNSVDILHTIYSSLGLLIICFALLPQTRKHYK